MQIDPLVQKRLAELIAKGEAVLAGGKTTVFRSRVVPLVERSDGIGYCASVSNLLQRAFGESSVHYKSFQDLASKFTGYASEFKNLQAVLLAAKEDYEGGYLFNVRGLVKAEVLDDALAQASALLDAGYKDPACVLVGVALEVTVKELADRNSVPRAKLDKMNVDLCKAGVYNVAKQKQITAWADLRNKAAHGDWTGYSKEDVKDMLQGVQRYVADTL